MRGSMPARSCAASAAFPTSVKASSIPPSSPVRDIHKSRVCRRLEVRGEPHRYAAYYSVSRYCPIPVVGRLHRARDILPLVARERAIRKRARSNSNRGVASGASRCSREMRQCCRAGATVDFIRVSLLIPQATWYQRFNRVQHWARCVRFDGRFRRQSCDAALRGKEFPEEQYPTCQKLSPEHVPRSRGPSFPMVPYSSRPNRKFITR